jgi:hypothetical protein
MGRAHHGHRPGAHALAVASLGGVLLTSLIGCRTIPSAGGTATAAAVRAAFATLDTASMATIEARVPPPASPTVPATTSAIVTATSPTASDIPPRADTAIPSAPPRSATATPAPGVAMSPAAPTTDAPSPAGGTVPIPSLQTYADAQGRFSFMAPADWLVEPSDQPGVAVQVVAGTISGNVNVATESATGITLDQYVTGALAGIAAQDPQYHLNPPGVQSATLGNRPGRRYDLQGQSALGPIHVTQFVTLVGDTAYVVTLTAPESDYDLFARESQVCVATFIVPADATGIGAAPAAVTPSAAP